jgi:hypothetical protein
VNDSEQLTALARVNELLEANEIEYWLFGGWVATALLLIVLAGDVRLPARVALPAAHRVVIVNSMGCRFGRPSALVVCRTGARLPDTPDALASRRP